MHKITALQCSIQLLLLQNIPTKTGQSHKRLDKPMFIFLFQLNIVHVYVHGPIQAHKDKTHPALFQLKSVQQ